MAARTSGTTSFGPSLREGRHPVGGPSTAGPVVLGGMPWHGAVPLAVAGSECQPPVTSTTRGQSALPTYQYRCTECDHEFEEFQSFTDDALTVCPVCGGRLRKVFNAVGVVFKGSGFYRTDSRAAGVSSTAASSSPANGSGDSGSSDAGTKTSGSEGSAESSSGSSGSKDAGSSGSKGSGSSGSGASSSSSSSAGSSSAG